VGGGRERERERERDYLPLLCQVAGDMLNAVYEWLRASDTRILQISSFSVMSFYAGTMFNA
jgi:hypothetical protein